MATTEEYAQWIVDNQDKQDSEEFKTVAQAYELSKRSSTPTETPGGAGVPQALTVGREFAGSAKDIAGTAFNVGRDVLGYPIDTLKNVAAWTPRSVAEVVKHPVITAKQYITNHPTLQNIMNSNASLSSVGRQAMGKISDVGSRMVAGAVAPESLFAAPYQMAAYEQEKIRANPQAPEYATNPYAQMYRGEYATQGAAGAANRRNAIAGQQYGGLTPEEQALLNEDRISREIRRKAASKVLGPVAPPTAGPEWFPPGQVPKTTTSQPVAPVTPTGSGEEVFTRLRGSGTWIDANGNTHTLARTSTGELREQIRNPAGQVIAEKYLD